MELHDFDLAIIGAGPAGCSAALFLKGSGLSIAVIDKSPMPSNKICGDALSGMVLSVLKRVPGNVFSDFLSEPGKQPCYGIRFTAPKGYVLDLPFQPGQGDMDGTAPGYVMKRIDFDGFLLQELHKDPAISFFPGRRVTEIKRDKDFILIESPDLTIRARMLIGADGTHSVTGRILAGNTLNRGKFCIGARGYFRNVGGLNDKNFIELLFLKELLPGYLWIFPMADGMANVGIGLMHDRVRRKKEKVKEKLTGILHDHPRVKERFQDAELVGDIETHGLASGPDPRIVSGERFLLAGDAASLIDPFTGEGIGNALASGEIAARIIREAFREQDFSAEFLKKYDEQLKKKFFGELKTDYAIHHLANYPFLFNFVVKKAIRNPEMVEIFRNMYTIDEIRALLTRPKFYLNLMFK